jgi:hypothetical protein
MWNRMALRDTMSRALVQDGYRSCFYLELHCSEHDYIRVAVEFEPA